MRAISGDDESRSVSSPRDGAMIGASLRRREDPAAAARAGPLRRGRQLPGHAAHGRGPLAVPARPARCASTSRPPGARRTSSRRLRAADLPEIQGPMGDPAPPGLQAAPRPVLARRYACATSASRSPWSSPKTPASALRRRRAGRSRVHAARRRRQRAGREPRQTAPGPARCARLQRRR